MLANFKTARNEYFAKEYPAIPGWHDIYSQTPEPGTFRQIGYISSFTSGDVKLAILDPYRATRYENAQTAWEEFRKQRIREEGQNKEENTSMNNLFCNTDRGTYYTEQDSVRPDRINIWFPSTTGGHVSKDYIEKFTSYTSKTTLYKLSDNAGTVAGVFPTFHKAWEFFCNNRSYQDEGLSVDIPVTTFRTKPAPTRVENEPLWKVTTKWYPAEDCREPREYTNDSYDPNYREAVEFMWGEGTSAAFLYKIVFTTPSENKTLCDIQTNFCDSIVTGVSNRNPIDVPNAETGRKLALQRALKKFPHDFRRAAWEAYLKRPGGIHEPKSAKEPKMSFTFECGGFRTNVSFGRVRDILACVINEENCTTSTVVFSDSGTVKVSDYDTLYEAYREAFNAARKRTTRYSVWSSAGKQAFEKWFRENGELLPPHKPPVTPTPPTPVTPHENTSQPNPLYTIAFDGVVGKEYTLNGVTFKRSAYIHETYENYYLAAYKKLLLDGIDVLNMAATLPPGVEITPWRIVYRDRDPGKTR